MSSVYDIYGQKMHNGKAIKLNPSLCSKKWTFIRAGLDDFRDRFPPRVTNYIVRQKPGPEPVLTGLKRDKKEKNLLNSNRNYNITEKLTCQEAFFSRKIPASERRRARIKELEETLLEHPLMLLPGLEEGLDPELYDEVIDILDPDLMNVIAETDLDSNNSEIKENSSEAGYSDSIDIDYQGFERKRKQTSKQTLDEKQEKKMKNLSRDFCRWTESLGAGEPKIDQETIETLFAPAKHKSTGPVQVVQLVTIPPELRAKAGLKPVPDNPEHSRIKQKPKSKFYRFGAWYLKSDSWKRMEKNEPLVDEEILQKSKNLQKQIQKETILQELASLHGTHVFRKFLENTNRKKPEFMKQIIKIQDARYK